MLIKLSTINVPFMSRVYLIRYFDVQGCFLHHQGFLKKIIDTQKNTNKKLTLILLDLVN